MISALFPAPKLYTVLYNVLKPVLPQATVEKVRMFGSDRKEWTAALLEEIDADQLPALYGGNLTDPDGDPKCPSLVRNIFERFFLTTKKF